MRDPGPSPKPSRRAAVTSGSSPGPTQASALLKRTLAAEDLAKTRGEDREPNDGKGRSEEKAAQHLGEPALDRTAFSPVDVSKSKSELYNEAKKAGIEGRSAMNKRELVEALGKHRAVSSPREAAPALTEVDTAEVVGPAADARGLERCAIVYSGTGRDGEFQVVLTETGSSRRCVARSPAFRAPTFGALRRQGAVRVAHELLVARLEACGWQPVDSGGPWHRLEFVRHRGVRSRRSLVTVVREAGEARFVAEELDTYGEPTPLLLSLPFGAPRFLPVRPSKQAKAALGELISRMESLGWRAAVAVGNEHWYAISLWRPGSTTGGPSAPRSRPGRPNAEFG